MDGTPCDAPNLRGRGSNGISTERNGERWLCVAGQCKVWIARYARGTMPEVNDRPGCDTIRYDRRDRYWPVHLIVLSALCRARRPSLSFLFPVGIGVHCTYARYTGRLSINARNLTSPILTNFQSIVRKIISALIFSNYFSLFWFDTVGFFFSINIWNIFRKLFL